MHVTVVVWLVLYRYPSSFTWTTTNRTSHWL